MNKTIAFIKLDYQMIKSNLYSNILVLLVMFFLIGYFFSQPYIFIGCLMLYSSFYTSYPCILGNKNEIKILYATLPLKKSSIVMGRYIFVLLLNIIMGMITFVAALILKSFLDKSFSWEKILFVVMICFAIVTILKAIQLPIYFKFTYKMAEKLVNLLYLPIFYLVSYIIVFFNQVKKGKYKSVILWVQENKMIIIIFVVLLWLLFMFFSGFLSYKYYKKREY